MLYHFTLILDVPAEDFTRWGDPLYEAGCDDALLGAEDGVVSLDFSRESDDDRESTIQGAIEQVESTGVKVLSQGSSTAKSLTRTNFLIMACEGVASMKMMPVREFTAEGYLQEVNRQFLHPLGLALVVEADTETGDERISGVWDARHDPEGLIFLGPRDVEKANRVYVRSRLMATAREAALGYVVQPLRDGGRHVVTPSAGDLIARLQGVVNAGGTREAGEAMERLVADGLEAGWLEQD